jgi:hypothetical protein
MHRYLASVALLVLFSTTLSAAVAYDFRQTHRSDRRSRVPAESQGQGLIDGDRSRVEFTGGNIYPAGAFIIATRGANSVIMANPATKSYSEVNLVALASRIASGEIEIRNLKTRVEKLPDHPTVSGLPTDHYRTETTYEISVRGSALTLTQNVHTSIEKWTTTAFGDVAGAFLDLDTFRTGNAQMDALLEAELSKVKGLPLRTVTTVTTTGTGNLARPGSKLEPQKRVQVSEILLSNVRIEPAPAASFEIPPGFSKAEARGAAAQSRVHMLSMEPEKR